MRGCVHSEPLNCSRRSPAGHQHLLASIYQSLSGDSNDKLSYSSIPESITLITVQKNQIIDLHLFSFKLKEI